MNLTAVVSEFSTQLSEKQILSTLWYYYHEWLWNYAPDSWVQRFSDSFRLLSFLVILPILVLTLLDLSAYGIARTLGVVDDLKASTSDKATIHGKPVAGPAILIHDPSTSSESTAPPSPSIGSDGQTLSRHRRGTSQPNAFYASEENILRLSGVGVFSPATSQPPSPSMSRKSLLVEGRFPGVEPMTVINDDGLTMRRRGAGQRSSIIE